jgi:hypothetical protein
MTSQQQGWRDIAGLGQGASADADRACDLRAEPAAQSQAEPLVPSAWAEAWGDQFVEFAHKTMAGAYDRWTERTPWHTRSRRAAFDAGFEIGARAALIIVDEVRAFAQGMETRKGGDGTAPSRSDDSSVGEADAPTPCSPSPRTGESDDA